MDFLCDLCGERGLARMADGLAEVGRSTEQGFKPLYFEIAPDLAATPRKRSLRLWYRGTQKDVPSRETALMTPRRPRSPAA